MGWTERQHGLLQAMGLRLWQPAVADVAVGVAVDVAVDAAVDVAVDAAVVPANLPHRVPHRVPPGVPATVPARPPFGNPIRARVALQAEPPARPAPSTDAAPEPAGRGGIDTLDWPALRDAVSACRACSLCAGRTQTVFGVGHPRAHWLVVGEAPGEDEDRQGEPFVGASGQLLDRMLAALRLSRSEDDDAPPARRAYIANTLKCRPPRNRNPTPAELALCEPFLQRQIELLQPRIILAMGRFAVDVLLRSDGPIGKLRGRVHGYRGVPVVVTYHPAYLLRNAAEKARAWEDLCLAADVAERSASAASP